MCHQIACHEPQDCSLRCVDPAGSVLMQHPLFLQTGYKSQFVSERSAFTRTYNCFTRFAVLWCLHCIGSVVVPILYWQCYGACTALGVLWYLYCIGSVMVPVLYWECCATYSVLVVLWCLYTVLAVLWCLYCIGSIGQYCIGSVMVRALYWHHTVAVLWCLYCIANTCISRCGRLLVCVHVTLLSTYIMKINVENEK